jgi:hypothetical protein
MGRAERAPRVLTRFILINCVICGENKSKDLEIYPFHFIRYNYVFVQFPYLIPEVD